MYRPTDLLLSLLLCLFYSDIYRVRPAKQETIRKTSLEISQRVARVVFTSIESQK